MKPSHHGLARQRAEIPTVKAVRCVAVEEKNLPLSYPPTAADTSQRSAQTVMCQDLGDRLAVDQNATIVTAN